MICDTKIIDVDTLYFEKGFCIKDSIPKPCFLNLDCLISEKGCQYRMFIYNTYFSPSLWDFIRRQNARRD